MSHPNPRRAATEDMIAKLIKFLDDDELYDMLSLVVDQVDAHRRVPNQDSPEPSPPTPTVPLQTVGAPVPVSVSEPEPSRYFRPTARALSGPASKPPGTVQEAVVRVLMALPEGEGLGIAEIHTEAQKLLPRAKAADVSTVLHRLGKRGTVGRRGEKMKYEYFLLPDDEEEESEDE